MYPAPFEYAAPTSIDEALGLLGRDSGDAKILAGGHSLLPLMKLRLSQPGLLVDIRHIPGLDFIRVEGDSVVVGAMASYREVERSPEVRTALPVLAEAASEVGDPQVRARGTVVGGLVHADPAGDVPAVALALGASIRVVGPGGERTIPADDFFVDMLTTAVDENEIALEARFPRLPAGAGASYLKIEQPASHYALAGVCAVVTPSADGKIGSARLGITGVGPKVYRPTAAEERLVGCEASAEAIDAAVADVAEGIDVLGDLHASPDYRAHLARVLARRAILAALERSTTH